MAIDEISPDLDGSGLRVGIVQARFNEWAGQALAQACIDELLQLGVNEDDITRVTVPGALEVPLTLARLTDAGDFDALIALGCVIRGDTPHFEYVAGEAARGLNQAALDTGRPVIFGVLTVETVAQAEERADPKRMNKGGEAMESAIEMALLLRQA